MPKCFVCSKNVVPLHRQNKKMTTSCDFGLWCNGNTTDSGPVFLGSSPSSPTKSTSNWKCFFIIYQLNQKERLSVLTNNLSSV